VYRGYRPEGSEFAIRILTAARMNGGALPTIAVWNARVEHRSLDYDERGLRSAADGKRIRC
jgi:hypothetical protein